MNIQITVNLGGETLSAIESLTEAVKSINFPQAPVPTDVTVKVAGSAKGDASDESKEKTEGPVYWADNDSGDFGKMDTEAEFKARKKKHPTIYLVPKSVYDEKLAKLKAKNEAAQAAAKAEKAEKVEKVEKAAAGKAEKPAKVEKPAKSSEPVPTEEELIDAFQQYLPKDLSKEERAARHAFVKPLLTRFGAARATELLPEHRALAINLVLRKLAGEDIDPESSEFAEICAEAEGAQDDDADDFV